MGIRAALALNLIFFALNSWAVSESLTVQEQVECSYAKARYSFLNKDSIECTENYLLFESDNKSRSTADIKIATFNVIRLGTDQSQFKRYDITADIINQWDLVSVVEIMPTPGNYQDHNLKVDQAVQQYRQHERGYSPNQVETYEQIISDSYKMPGYLRLLQALRELDPSWSLVMAPKATGDLPNSLEMTGFFYRSGRVKNITSSFCEGKRGCMLPVGDVSNLLSRVPFFSSFKSGKLTLHAVSLHLRFRDAEDVGRSFTLVSKEEKKWMEKFSDVKDPMFRGRFIELAIIASSLKKSRNNVMILGDFNLRYNPKGFYQNASYWSRALADDGKNVYVHSKTSISRQNGLSGEYDHFIFNPKKITRCNPDTAAAFNFILDFENPVSEEPALDKLSQLLLQRNKSPDSVADQFAEVEVHRKRLSECSEKKCELIPFYNDSDLNTLLNDYNHRIVNTKKAIRYKFYEDLISDHIPISMSCKTN